MIQLVWFFNILKLFLNKFAFFKLCKRDIYLFPSLYTISYNLNVFLKFFRFWITLKFKLFWLSSYWYVFNKILINFNSNSLDSFNLFIWDIIFCFKMSKLFIFISKFFISSNKFFFDSSEKLIFDKWIKLWSWCSFWQLIHKFFLQFKQ